MKEVVAALIKDEEGRFLICQRPPQKTRGLQWEFVGGKVETGETLSEALVRECKEELDIAVTVKNIFCDVTHRYPDLDIHLTVFNATISGGFPKLLEHNAFAWIKPSQIDDYVFCPADVVVLKKIKAESDGF